MIKMSATISCGAKSVVNNWNWISRFLIEKYEENKEDLLQNGLSEEIRSETNHQVEKLPGKHTSDRHDPIASLCECSVNEKV